MKKLTIILTVLICSINSFSQVLTEEQAQRVIRYKTFCVDQSKKEAKNGVILQLAGLSIYGASRLNAINGTKLADKKWMEVSERIYQIKKANPDYWDYKAEGDYMNRLDNAHKFKKAGFITGCVFAVVGLGLQVHSITWLRRAYIGENGVGIKFYLDK